MPFLVKEFMALDQRMIKDSLAHPFAFMPICQLVRSPHTNLTYNATFNLYKMH